MDWSLRVVGLVVLGLAAVNAGVVLLVCARGVAPWMRRRRARRIEESFRSETFTVPVSWVREARRRRPSTGS